MTSPDPLLGVLVSVQLDRDEPLAVADYETAQATCEAARLDPSVDAVAILVRSRPDRPWSVAYCARRRFNWKV